MNQDFLIGTALLGIGLVLIVIGWPKGGESPRLLRFGAALVLYPPFIMVSLASGIAAILTALRRAHP